MEDRLTALFNEFDRGNMSRRQLLVALGLAAVATPLRAFGQGSCGGANAGTPRCDTMPFKPPFEPTGWKTVLLDHFSLQVVDYKAEAAFYSALMGWKLRSDDGTKAIMDMGELGGVIIRGGITPPPPPPPATPPAGGDTAGRAAGAGRGRGGGGGGGGTRAIWDNFCWGIEPWDTAKVEAALKARGLNPVADHSGNDFRSFHVKDPDGFDVQVSNGNKRNRRTTPATGKHTVPLPFDETGWKTLWLDHISLSCTSYKESTAFYAALLGWKPGADEGSQNSTDISPTIGGLIIRGGNANAPGGLTAGRRGGGAGTDTAGRAGQPAAPPAPLVRRTVLNHISFGIADFDPDKVLAELQKRNLRASVDTGGNGDIHTARYKSYHTRTPNNYDLQISNTIAP